jgi:hypothetical protein
MLADHSRALFTGRYGVQAIFTAYAEPRAAKVPDIHPIPADGHGTDASRTAAGDWTMLNQIPVPKEPLPMIESEHDNLTPD